MVRVLQLLRMQALLALTAAPVERCAELERENGELRQGLADLDAPARARSLSRSPPSRLQLPSSPRAMAQRGPAPTPMDGSRARRRASNPRFLAMPARAVVWEDAHLLQHQRQRANSGARQVATARVVTSAGARASPQPGQPEGVAPNSACDELPLAAPGPKLGAAAALEATLRRFEDGREAARRPRRGSEPHGRTVAGGHSAEQLPPPLPLPWRSARAARQEVRRSAGSADSSPVLPAAPLQRGRERRHSATARLGGYGTELLGAALAQRQGLRPAEEPGAVLAGEERRAGAARAATPLADAGGEEGEAQSTLTAWQQLLQRREVYAQQHVHMQWV